MGQLEKQLASVLNKRQQIAKRRQLVVNSPTAIDFSSNDFLGLAQNTALRQRYLNELESMETILGSTGSRLLDGNSQYAFDLERQIAQFHRADTALLFNSGFDANTGLLSTLPQKGDIVIYDELIHASVHEGMRVSRAGRLIPFKHSNVTDLDRVLTEIGSTDKNVFIAVETVYSMDGDVVPLVEIVQLLRKYWPKKENGYIIVDEAHATGVYGENGRGVVCQLGLEKEIFARLHTFGKSLASNGAAVLGSNTLRDYLINYARPLIYSTFMSFNSLASVKCAYDILECGETQEIQTHLHNITRQFREAIQLPTGTLLPSDSPIQGIVLNGNAPVRALAGYLNKRGFIVKPICSPTVPKGQERVRICLHGHNTAEQVDALVASVHQFFNVQKSNMVASSTSVSNTLEPAKL
ncbi:pyridoxal phosphate-dependent transferase [Phascolomyces articulosus]|uniref:Pyridoxal phosphate-dependent transferase n=1 Tax=Phascolomyces articulosus TaxID=60185 RepID=A0AAD5JNM1_9FUNG|nr:pyridoxal phosphate-dependent transferase [Phascolomyces articulosus]